MNKNNENFEESLLRVSKSLFYSTVSLRNFNLREKEICKKIWKEMRGIKGFNIENILEEEKKFGVKWKENGLNGYYSSGSHCSADATNILASIITNT